MTATVRKVLKNPNRKCNLFFEILHRVCKNAPQLIFFHFFNLAGCHFKLYSVCKICAKFNFFIMAATVKIDTPFERY